MKKQIPKILILTLLLTLCLLKYNGCLNKPTENTTTTPPQSTFIEKILNKPTEEEEKQKIQEKTTEFLEALKTEDIEQILKLSSKKTLKSIINIPVDHIETYEIQEINKDKKTAQVKTKINNTANTIIYLHKNPEWKVTNTLTP